VAARIVSRPVSRKFGIMVNAVSQACQAVAREQGGPIALIKIPSGAVFPCLVSK
jgi:hypothetical protein